MSENPLSKLAEISVVKLNFGSAALRRKIKRAGYSNILELFSLCDDEIDSIFDFNEADEIIALRNRFQSDPEQVARSFLHVPEIDRERVDAIISEASREGASTIGSRADEPARKPFIDAVQPVSLPDLPCVGVLTKLETDIALLFDILLDQYDEPLGTTKGD